MVHVHRGGELMVSCAGVVALTHPGGEDGAVGRGGAHVGEGLQLAGVDGGDGAQLGRAGGGGAAGARHQRHARVHRRQDRDDWHWRH